MSGCRAVRIQHFSAQAFCRLLDCIYWIDTGNGNAVLLVQNESSNFSRAAARSRSTSTRCVVGHRRKIYHPHAMQQPECQTPAADCAYQILSHCVVPSLTVAGPQLWNMLRLVANYTRFRCLLKAHLVD